MRLVETTMFDKVFNVQSLMLEHWSELVDNPQALPLKLQLERYKTLEDAGVLVCILAYEEDVIIGYSVGILLPHPHHADVLVLSNDAMFLSKSHRRGNKGTTLIKETERAAKRHGAALVAWNAQLDTSLNALLPRLGYSVANVVYKKEVLLWAWTR